MHQPKHLDRWFEQVNYAGDGFDDHYVAAWRFIRAVPEERSNFNYVREHLRDCGQTEGYVEAAFTDEVMIARYYLLIHQDSDRLLRMADMFAERVTRKGVLDPDDEQPRHRHIRDVRGHFCSLYVKNGPLIQPTSVTRQRKSRVVEKELAKREQVAREIHAITGTPVQRIARSIDGINRRWVGVKNTVADA